MYKTCAAGFSASVLELAFIVLTCILNNQIMRYGGEVALAVFGVVLTFSGMYQHIYTGVGQAIQPIVATNFVPVKTGASVKCAGFRSIPSVSWECCSA